MIVDSAFLITGRQTPRVFQPIDQPLDPLAETVESTIKRASAVFILLSWDGAAEPVAPQVLANLATTIGLVTHETTRPAFGAPAPTPFHSPAFHQGFEGHGFVPLARGEDQRHQLAPAFRANMDFRTEAALTAAERFGLWVPCGGPSRVVVRADNRALHIVDGPVQVLGSVGTRLDRSKEASPDTRLAPAIKAAGDGGPTAIPLGEVAPWGTGTDAPEDAVADASMVNRWAACERFLRREQGWEPFPLSIGKVMSMHTQKYTDQNRVCKHTLV